MLPVPIVRRVSVLAMAALMTGCSLVPTYQRPAAPLALDWATPQTAGASRPVAVADRWWTTFNSPELTRLEDGALTGNFDLQAAVARLREAEATATIAGAALYPSVDLAITSERKTSLQVQLNNSAVLEPTYEADLWGKNRATADSATALAHATQFDAQTAALTLTGAVANTYINALSLQARVKLAQTIANDAAQILKLIQAQSSLGAASQLEVEQQRNAVATFDAAVVTLQQQFEQSLHSLAVLVGVSPSGFKLGANNLDGLEVPTVASSKPSDVIVQRPDIRAAEARLISANFDIGAARAALLPDISITATFGLTNQNHGKILGPLALPDLMTSLLQPVFAGGALRGQLNLDRAHAEELIATYRQSIELAYQDVEDALSAAARLEALGRIDGVAVDSARRASSLADAQYRLGATDFLTFLTTERTLYQAEDALLQVRALRLQAAVALFQAFGGGIDTNAALQQTMTAPIPADPLALTRQNPSSE
ncbi:efflux transporter outer membrane subunit [Arboricoccus pini]|uniref:efflux transporter outer membrane subunit n=1 Tax=Arboricoccus pini TaxID=1963835 RepID=UPI0038990073